MLITHRSTYAASSIIVSTNSIASACNTITLDNFGDDDVKVYINDTAHAHAGTYLYLKAGNSKDIGGSMDAYVNDIFDLVFMGVGNNPGVNILKETFLLLS